MASEYFLAIPGRAGPPYPSGIGCCQCNLGTVSSCPLPDVQDIGTQENGNADRVEDTITALNSAEDA